MVVMDHFAEAQKAAELHLEACWASLNDDGPEPDVYAPFCGCLTCEVRETLYAALPHLQAGLLEYDEQPDLPIRPITDVELPK